ncbi:RAMP superfamily CRISPR-associated protein [Caldimonas sp.]|uniref:RAMP superfamily CRISPR-associated protein n=1 Tax=Caldimonas sp. TaxID=2838790 RepID=UPI0029DC89F0|nr:hypothetical protein [Caldimonas manganoxidans]
MLTIWNYKIQFVTPAFLGDADQSGAWRTPPFKAQLRQWWRVMYSADHDHRVSVDEMRKHEARLFGAANDGQGSSTQSLVRLRLDRWSQGTLKRDQWKSLDPVGHPEVPGRRPTADLYLGYGPVTLKAGPLKARAAIQAGETATLQVVLDERVTEQDRARLQAALHLMHLLGTVGGRSRNGWGSYILEPGEKTPAWEAVPAGISRPWREAMERVWAHALGRDERGALVWKTPNCKDWREAMVRLAQLKIKLRTQFKFRSGQGASEPELRHWLAYPVTNHIVKDWGDRLRLPNTLRFKLRPVDGNDGVVGWIFHMPAWPPSGFAPQRWKGDILQLWPQVHQFLDQALAPRASL